MVTRCARCVARNLWNLANSGFEPPLAPYSFVSFSFFGLVIVGWDTGGVGAPCCDASVLSDNILNLYLIVIRIIHFYLSAN